MRVALVRPLVGTAVTPNHLTTVRLATGLAAAVCLAAGKAPWWDIGAGLFVLSVLFDRADGDLARLTGKSSPWGHAYDLVSDGVCNSLVFVGLGVGLMNNGFGPWAAPLGVLAGAAVAIILWLVISMESIGGQRAAELKSVSGFDYDDAILMVPAAIWFGWQEELLMAAAAITPLVTLLFVWMYFKKKRETL